MSIDILIKQLVLLEADKMIPVFLYDSRTQKDPSFVITTKWNDKKYCNKKNKEFKETCNSFLEDEFFCKIPFSLRKIRMKKEFNKIYSSKYTIIRYVSDDEDTAFVPDITLLDFLYRFCKKHNCMNTFESILKYILTYFHADKVSTIFNPDALASMRYSKDVHFKWVNKSFVDKCVIEKRR